MNAATKKLDSDKKIKCLNHELCPITLCSSADVGGFAFEDSECVSSSVLAFSIEVVIGAKLLAERFSRRGPTGVSKEASDCAAGASGSAAGASVCSRASFSGDTSSEEGGGTSGSSNPEPSPAQSMMNLVTRGLAARIVRCSFKSSKKYC